MLFRWPMYIRKKNRCVRGRKFEPIPKRKKKWWGLLLQVYQQEQYALPSYCVSLNNNNPSYSTGMSCRHRPGRISGITRIEIMIKFTVTYSVEEAGDDPGPGCDGREKHRVTIMKNVGLTFSARIRQPNS